MTKESLSKIKQAKVNGGPLDSHISMFTNMLLQRGYRATTLKSKIVILKRFNMWLGCRGQPLENIDKQAVISFFEEHPRPGHVKRGDLLCLLKLIEYLHEIGVSSSTSSRIVTNALQCFVDSYSRYLKHERRLSESTMATYIRIASLFLSQNTDSQIEVGCNLSCQKVTEFICQAAPSMSPRYTQLITSALRSLLRYLYLTGKTATNLSPCVPTVAEWKLSTLPKYLEAPQVEAILGSIDNSTEIGLRDHAILLFLARLGLRACEITNMTLEDINWDLGHLTVRENNHRHTFTVKTLLGWYQSGVNVEQRMPYLSTYLGHRHVKDTYWYLTAVPELLKSVTDRLDVIQGGQP